MGYMRRLVGHTPVESVSDSGGPFRVYSLCVIDYEYTFFVCHYSVLIFFPAGAALTVNMFDLFYFS